MSPLAADLAIYQGDDWGATVLVYQADGVTPADLTGYTAQAQIRSGTADQQWLPAAEIACTVALPNQIALFLTHDQTETLGGQWYCWDLQITSPAGLITTILRGQVCLQYEITREADVEVLVL